MSGDAARLSDAAASPRPRVRGDCINAARPCPHVECRYHCGDAAGTCALDIADNGAATYAEIAALLGVTREWIRQIEIGALARLRTAGLLSDWAPDLTRPPPRRYAGRRRTRCSPDPK